MLEENSKLPVEKRKGDFIPRTITRRTTRTDTKRGEERNIGEGLDQDCKTIYISCGTHLLANIGGRETEINERVHSTRGQGLGEEERRETMAT